MNGEHPIADLKRLERLLAASPRPEPAAALRQRVLGGVQTELHRSVYVETRGDDFVPRWQFATAAAVIVFVWAGLSLTAAQVAYSALQPQGANPAVAQIAKQIQQLSPDFLPEESFREARLLQLAGEVTSRPVFGEKLPASGLQGRDGAKPEESQGPDDSQRAAPSPDARGADQPGAGPQGAGVLNAIECDYA
jgi:hypothetical protein